MSAAGAPQRRPQICFVGINTKTGLGLLSSRFFYAQNTHFPGAGENRDLYRETLLLFAGPGRRGSARCFCLVHTPLRIWEKRVLPTITSTFSDSVKFIIMPLERKLVAVLNFDLTSNACKLEKLWTFKKLS